MTKCLNFRVIKNQKVLIINLRELYTGYSKDFVDIKLIKITNNPVT